MSFPSKLVVAAARMALAEGLPLRTTETLLGYLEGFWLPGSAYILKRESRDRHLSKRYTGNMAAMITRYVKPYLETKGKARVPLSRMTAGMFEGLIQWMRAEGKSATLINQVRQAVAVPIAEAYRNGLIVTNPAVDAAGSPGPASCRGSRMKIFTVSPSTWSTTFAGRRRPRSA